MIAPSKNTTKPKRKRSTATVKVVIWLGVMAIIAFAILIAFKTDTSQQQTVLEKKRALIQTVNPDLANAPSQAAILQKQVVKESKPIPYWKQDSTGKLWWIR